MESKCPRKVIRVGTRKSELAMIQTKKVVEQMKKFHPGMEFEIVGMSTTGDNILNIALSKIGEKSLFTKELENALYDNRVDFVVHSLKDLPTTLPEGLCIAAVCKRDSPYDAVVMHPKYKDRTLDTLPEHCAAIGTSSLRRASQLKAAYPNLKFADIRGNLNTRLRKLDDHEDYSAIILAVAGMKRMGWADRITQELTPKDCMYAVSQGAMAVECRDGDKEILNHLSSLHHEETVLQCVAERSFLRELEGGCSVPVAVHTEVMEDKISMKGGVFSLDGKESRVESVEKQLPDESEAKKMRVDGEQYACIVADNLNPSHLAAAEDLGKELAVKVLSDGGARILNEAKRLTAIEAQKKKPMLDAAKKKVENGTAVQQENGHTGLSNGQGNGLNGGIHKTCLAQT